MVISDKSSFQLLLKADCSCFGPALPSQTTAIGFTRSSHALCSEEHHFVLHPPFPETSLLLLPISAPWAFVYRHHSLCSGRLASHTPDSILHLPALPLYYHRLFGTPLLPAARRLLNCVVSWCFLPPGLRGGRDHAGSLCERTAYLQRQVADQSVCLAQNPQDILQEEQLLHQNPAWWGERTRADVLQL